MMYRRIKEAGSWNEMLDDRAGLHMSSSDWWSNELGEGGGDWGNSHFLPDHRRRRFTGGCNRLNSGASSKSGSQRRYQGEHGTFSFERRCAIDGNWI